MSINIGEVQTRTDEDSRSMGIMRRQRERMIEQQGVWHALDDVSILDEDPNLSSEPLIVRKALAIRRLLLAMPATIEPDELIVGTFRARRFDQPKLPEYITVEERARYGISRDYGHYGHCALDYDSLIRLGLEGLRAKSQAGLERLADDESEASERQRAFYRATLIICDALRDFAARYVALAEEATEAESDPRRAAELQRIAEICRHVPEHPARSFYEALQSFVFYHVAIHAVHFDGALGRIDQCFYPLLQNDLDSGALTDAEAQELTDCFALKINDCAWNWVDREVRRGVFHNVVLAGQRPDGSDATNAFSYMLLDSLRRLITNFPTVAVRLHKRSPERLIRACCEVMRSNAGAPALYNDEVIVPGLVEAGIPIEDARDFANDGCWETTVCGRTQFSYITFSATKALEWVLTRGRGMPIDWKRALRHKSGETYEPVPPEELAVQWPDDLGPAGPEYWPMATDGLRSSGQRTFGDPIDTGDPLSFETFEELMAALETQLDHQVKCEMTNYVARYWTDASQAFGVRGPTPLASLLIGDCLERGRAYGDGGEQYTVCGVNVCAIANAADSLCAIKRFVYDTQALSMAQLLELLRTNFAGAEDIRNMLVTRAPKYGNGDPEADAMAARLLNVVGDAVEKYAQMLAVPDRFNMIWGMLAGTFEWAPAHGASIGATADGRRASEPSATNLGFATGAAMHGPTAALRSYASLPLQRLRTGAPLDLTIDGTTLSGEAGLQRMVGFVRSFVDLGGNLMTITLADAATLRHAQEEPDKYRHLRVRLGGSQAYFVGLGRDMQDYYIKRAEQGSL